MTRRYHCVIIWVLYGGTIPQRDYISNLTSELGEMVDITAEQLSDKVRMEAMLCPEEFEKNRIAFIATCLERMRLSNEEEVAATGRFWLNNKSSNMPRGARMRAKMIGVAGTAPALIRTQTFNEGVWSAMGASENGRVCLTVLCMSHNEIDKTCSVMRVDVRWISPTDDFLDRGGEIIWPEVKEAARLLKGDDWNWR